MATMSFFYYHAVGENYTELEFDEMMSQNMSQNRIQLKRMQIAKVSFKIFVSQLQNCLNKFKFVNYMFD